MVRGGVRRIFLLSPAKVGGVRAQLLLNKRSAFPLARQFQRDGLPLADVFSFASALYFRGKITYARRFAAGGDLVRVITPNAGLVDPDLTVCPADVLAYGRVNIDETNSKYTRPLRRDASAVAAHLTAETQVVLLGSIATGKYRDILLSVFGERLLFPADFVGRGDMSRGALMLRAARSGTELRYITVQGAVLVGKRAARIADM